MTTLVISTQPQYTFGAMTNRMTNALVNGNTMIERLKDAIATASAGFEGTPGTQFEVDNVNGSEPNLFGILASATPGEQGQSYSYAMGRLHELWTEFWTEAQPFVEQLDNGTTGF